MYTCTCEYCGKEFQSSYKDVKICKECKNRPCEVCGKPFVHDWPYDQHCCSKECRAIWKSDPERNKEWTEKRQQTVQERYGVSNVTYLDSAKEKAHEKKAAKKAERDAVREEERRIKQEQKRIEKEERVKEQKEAKIQASIRKCKLCGQEFIPTSGRNFYCRRDHYATCKICGDQYVIKYADLPYPRNVCYNVTCAVAWRKKRNLEIYGTEDSGNLPENIEKRRQTNLQKYGVDNPFKSEEVKQKIVETNLERYGVDRPTKCDVIKAKQAKTFNERWGDRLNELNSKRAQTCLKKYGVSNPRLIPDVEYRIQQTNLERYGSKFPQTELLKSITNHRKIRLSQVSNLNRSYKKLLDDVGWDTQFEFNIENKWFDLWCPDHSVLVEIDPTFTHYTDGKQIHPSIRPIDKRSQLDKTELANKYGYHCVHVFDWDDKYKIVQLLKRNREKIYARKCSICEVDVNTAREFEQLYHLQGPVRGQLVNIGLYIGDLLIEIMSFGAPRYNENYQWELLRLCSHSDYQVVGGASRLFHHFIQMYSPKSIISYCDRSKFSGSVYEYMGMTLHHVTPPARIWSKGKQKWTDNLLRQQGFDRLSGTSHGKGTSNIELAIQNGWQSVYDCGQLVYEWSN